MDDGAYASWTYTAMALSNAAPGEVVKFGYNGFFSYDQEEFPDVKVGWSTTSFALTANVVVNGWVWIRKTVRSGYTNTFTKRIDDYSFSCVFPTMPTMIIVWPQDSNYNNSGTHYYATPLMFRGPGHASAFAMYNSQLVSIQADCDITFPTTHPYGNAEITISAFQNNAYFTNVFNNSRYSYTPVTCLLFEFDNIFDYGIII